MGRAKRTSRFLRCFLGFALQVQPCVCARFGERYCQSVILCAYIRIRIEGKKNGGFKICVDREAEGVSISYLAQKNT